MIRASIDGPAAGVGRGGRPSGVIRHAWTTGAGSGRRAGRASRRGETACRAQGRCQAGAMTRTRARTARSVENDDRSGGHSPANAGRTRRPPAARRGRGALAVVAEKPSFTRRPIRVSIRRGTRGRGLILLAVVLSVESLWPPRERIVGCGGSQPHRPRQPDPCLLANELVKFTPAPGVVGVARPLPLRECPPELMLNEAEG